MTPRAGGPSTVGDGLRVSGAAPSLVAVTVVAGTGMAAVVATSLGLMPLFGEPELGTDGWSRLSPDLLPSIRESLTIAGAATALAAAVGLFLAGLMLLQGRAANLIRVVCVLVLAVPHLVGATSVGLLLSDGGVACRLLGVTDSWPALVGGSLPFATVLELAWKESAFVALVVVAAIGPGHRTRSEVAAGLGAGPIKRWTRVVLPTAAPALAASSLVTFVYAIGSYEVAWLLGRAVPEPLPVMAFRLFGSIELADRPAAAAAATVGAALSVGIAGVVLLALPRLRTALGADPLATDTSTGATA
ncbi:ABC transporter permease subunit [Nocardioides sp.]|uniref:ABC transporter permease subunit n=1 Tax=Nocardioides sp. TaxID=35761 RepID=UPI00356542B4